MSDATKTVRAASERVRDLAKLVSVTSPGPWSSPPAYCTVYDGNRLPILQTAAPMQATLVATFADPLVAEAVAELMVSAAHCCCDCDDCLAVLSCAEVLADRLGAA